MSAGKGEEDPTWTLGLVLVLVLIVCFAIWKIFDVQILSGMRYLRMAEIFIVNLFTNEMHACFNWLKVANVGKVLPGEDAFAWSAACFGSGITKLPSNEALNYYNITPTSLGVLTDRLSVYMRWPAAIICGWMAVFAFYISPRNKFRTKYTLESFIRMQAKMWPIISPIVNFNPGKFSARVPGDPVPDKLPAFAEALSPEEWISYHRIPVVNGIPDREATRRAFQLQLGPRWHGFEDLPQHIRALIAAFILRGSQKRDESEDFLGKLAVCWSIEKGLVLKPEIISEIDKILRDPEMSEKALKIANDHAYRTTAVLSILKWARFMGGVLAPAQFLWLRAVDRNLWYPLNNLGRRSFHSEGAGAIAHFMAEQGAKKALPIPRVDTAIVTLNQYMGRAGVVIPPREEKKKNING